MALVSLLLNHLELTLLNLIHTGAVLNNSGSQNLILSLDFSFRVSFAYVDTVPLKFKSRTAF
jgi:hypothetical protein